MTTIEVERNGQYVAVDPGNLTTEELCRALDQIQLDSDELGTQKEIIEGYAAIGEAIQRLTEAEAIQRLTETAMKEAY